MDADGAEGGRERRGRTDGGWTFWDGHQISSVEQLKEGFLGDLRSDHFLHPARRSEGWYAFCLLEGRLIPCNITFSAFSCHRKKPYLLHRQTTINIMRILSTRHVRPKPWDTKFAGRGFTLRCQISQVLVDYPFVGFMINAAISYTRIMLISRMHL